MKFIFNANATGMAKYRWVFWSCLYTASLLSSCAETQVITFAPQARKTVLIMIMAPESAGEVLNGIADADLHPLAVSTYPQIYAGTSLIRLVVTVNCRDRSQVDKFLSGHNRTLLRSVQIQE